MSTQHYISCSEKEFQNTFKFIFNLDFKSIHIIPLYFRGKSIIFRFYTNDIEKELPKYTEYSYSQDINNILYEPTNTTMTFYEIMKTPYVLSAHVFNLTDEPKFKIIYGKECNCQTFYHVPKLNKFIEERNIKNTKLIYGHHLFKLDDFTRYFILWNYTEIEKELKNQINLNFDKVISEDKVGSEVCKVCMTNGVNTLFKPCMHAASCQKCSDQLNECHICKSKIVKKRRIYLC
ncbi:hypothetical protein AGMMS49579_01110 [Spirochaetia bacterium]|nr:hypothetical protein AGMMS49579_01110 [Spirochaetia bacterium]